MSIPSSSTTPAITARVQEGFVEIAGESYPENSVEFYQPLVRWLQEFMTTQKRHLTLHLRIPYFNTSSSKCLLDMLDMLQSYHYISGGAVEVTWWYDEHDEDMLESGKDLSENLDLKFVLMPYTGS
ncbi:MAG: DUF1987 domain-containing protein [Bacteroidota bacterium]|nr:DUF1987 domain-containing protein [Bacteroidota bacterium]